MKKILPITLILLCLASAAHAAPVLCFTDLVDGPKTGLGDGLGSGAIVTVWGWNLGSSQGASTITIGGVAPAYVYYWGNADGGASGGGPSDLYSYHKMQEISFSVPSGVADGSVNIQVTVSAVASNTLPFYVRSGEIFYVASGGSGSTGSWAAPFASVTAAIADADFSIGDIVYIKDDYTESATIGANKVGTSTTRCAIISYPGSLYQNSSGITSYAGGTSIHPYWVLSKLKVYNNSSPISISGQWRIIGNEITDNTSATGEGGAVLGSGNPDFNGGLVGATDGPVVCYGNYIHDFGYAGTSFKHHVFYISNRGRRTVEADDGNCYECILDHTSSSVNKPYNGSGSWQTYWAASSMGADYCPSWATSTNYDDGKIYTFELGWNYLLNNGARNGLHIYDEHQCGDYLGTIGVHHNAVINQAGASVAVGTLGVYNAEDDPCISAPVNVYNNIVVKSGQSPHSGYTGFNIYGQKMTSQVNVYNNTLYGYVGSEAHMDVNGPGGLADYDFAGTWNCVNNIFFDTDNKYWTLDGYVSKTPSLFADTVFYDGGDNNPVSPPAWATGAVESDPLFTNAAANDFTLQAGSPALNIGAAPLSGAPFSGYGIDGSILDADIGAYGESGTAQTTRSMGAKPGLLP